MINIYIYIMIIIDYICIYIDIACVYIWLHNIYIYIYMSIRFCQFCPVCQVAGRKTMEEIDEGQWLDMVWTHPHVPSEVMRRHNPEFPNIPGCRCIPKARVRFPQWATTTHSKPGSVRSGNHQLWFSELFILIAVILISTTWNLKHSL